MTESQTLPPHVQRVVQEHRDLYNNINKLGVYVQNGMPGASEKEKELLVNQLGLMTQLSDVLVERIGLYTPAMAAPDTTIIGIASVESLEEKLEETKEETLEEALPAHVPV